MLFQYAWGLARNKLIHWKVIITFQRSLFLTPIARVLVSWRRAMKQMRKCGSMLPQKTFMVQRNSEGCLERLRKTLHRGVYSDRSLGLRIQYDHPLHLTARILLRVQPQDSLPLRLFPYKRVFLSLFIGSTCEMDQSEHNFGLQGVVDTAPSRKIRAICDRLRWRYLSKTD